MLNLYLATKGTVSVAPEAEASLLAFLVEAQLVGEQTEDGEWTPGNEVAWLFNDEAHEALLPAELTFGSLSIERSARPRFLPEVTEVFEEARCTVCGDPLNLDQLSDELSRLSLFPVERFGLECPSCCTRLGVKAIDFGQPTAVTDFWIYIEGAGTSRLAHRVLERFAKLLGQPLVVVPEVVDEALEDWIPPPGRRWPGRSGGGR